MGKVRIAGGFWIVGAMWLLLIPLPWVAGCLLAATVHELGHFLAIRGSGGRVRCLELGPTGARIVTDAMDSRQELFCAAAGPLAGSLVILLWRWFPQAAVAAVVQTVFNLLPVYPLDGGRILRNICCKREHIGV